MFLLTVKYLECHDTWTSTETDTYTSKHREPNQGYRIGMVSNSKYSWELLGLKPVKWVSNLAVDSEVVQNIWFGRTA